MFCDINDIWFKNNKLDNLKSDIERINMTLEYQNNILKLIVEQLSKNENK